MFIKKKRGVVLLETIIIVNVVMMLIFLYSKQNFINLKKTKYYWVKDDILTLSLEEEELINEAIEYIYSNKDIHEKLIIEKSFKELIFKKIYSKDSEMSIENDKEKIYIIDKKFEKRKYRELSLNISNGKDIILTPTTYETEYINE